ncbi:MAG: DUF1893 domain-containing protein [Calditrichaeota bacterium]|nr:DUF1893 domain-containing protein [Calditrichota bacterium]
MRHSLEVYRGKTLLYFSDKKWLHPLFELERFLRKSEIDPAELLVKDKIIGRAAALIICHLGIKKVHAQTLSRLAQEALDFHKVAYTYDLLIDAVACKTELLLRDELDPLKGYLLVRERVEASGDASSANG